MRINWTFLSALCLAGISLYFSAHGLASLFAGIGVAAIVLAIFFEFAKVTTTLHLIRNWGLRPLPILLSGFVMVLVLISSAGIFGYLRGAYQEGRVEQAVNTGAVQIVEEQIKNLEEDRARLYSLVEAIPETHSTNRLRVYNEVRPQIEMVEDQIGAKRDELAAFKMGDQVMPGHYAPVAEMLGISEAALISGIITTLALILDPLAVLLVLASGVHRYRREKYAVQTEDEEVQEEGTVPYTVWHSNHDAAGFCYHTKDDPRFDCWNPPQEEAVQRGERTRDDPPPGPSFKMSPALKRVVQRVTRQRRNGNKEVLPKCAVKPPDSSVEI